MKPLYIIIILCSPDAIQNPCHNSLRLNKPIIIWEGLIPSELQVFLLHIFSYLQDYDIHNGRGGTNWDWIEVG